jgi:hypothetical protein
MKKTYTKPSVVVSGDVVRETRNSMGKQEKPHWPYPEGVHYAYSAFEE